MYNHRKTNSYDLVGTNARNSDLSMNSNNYRNYGENMIGSMSFENSEQQLRFQAIDQILSSSFALPLQKKASENKDFVD